MYMFEEPQDIDAMLFPFFLLTSGAQEYTKALTCTDTPVNSAVGGAAAGTLLFISHGGNPVLGAGIVAAMGYTIDLLVRQLGAGVEHDSGRAAESEDSDDDQGKGFFDMNRLLRKTTDEERKAFLEQRRRRILRMDPTQSD